MENDSLVDRENDLNSNEIFPNMMDSIFLNTKIIKTIILVFIIFMLIFFAETNFLLNENSNLLEYKSFHIAEILENFYDSIELFFYKTKPRTKSDYTYSHLTIKDYFEKNHLVNSFMNMSYFFEEFHFTDLYEITKEMDENLSENFEDYSKILTEFAYNNIHKRETLNKSSNKDNLYNMINKIDDKNNEFLEYKNFNFYKNNFTYILKSDFDDKLKSNEKSSDSFTINFPFGKNRKINKIKTPNNKIIMKHEHLLDDYKVRSTNDIKTLSKIQLIKNLIEFERNSDINLLPILQKSFRKNNTKFNETTEEIQFDHQVESNLYFKDLTRNILINSYLNYYNKKYEKFKNIDDLFQSFKKNKKISNYSSLTDNDKIILKKEYNRKLINILNIYENTVNFEKDDEYYFNYNKELNNKFLYYYYLMNNLTSYDFKGKWNGLNQNIFLLNNQGKVNLEIKKNYSQLKNVNINYNIFNSNENNLIDFFDYFRNLEFSFYAIDGDYKNNWMIFNFTIDVPENFIDFVDIFEENKKMISIKNDNVQVRFFIGEFLETKTKLICKNSKLILEFVDKQHQSIKNLPNSKRLHFSNINELKFSYLKGKIINPECGINLEFSLEANIIDVIKLFNLIINKKFLFLK